MAYAKYLNVSTPNGRRVKVIVDNAGDQVHITSGYFEQLELDKPPFSKKGKLRITIEKEKFLETIAGLEKYFESLFLQEMLHEDNNSSNRKPSNTRGNKKPSTKGKDGLSSGKGSTKSVRTSTRGSEQAESNRGRDKEPEVVEEDHRPSVESD